MSKQTRATIIPWEGQYNGPFLIPSSEQSYRAHGRLIDAVLPTHGGILLPDSGEWTRHDSAGSDFARELRRMAVRRYYPVCIPYGMNDKDAFLALLEQPRRWLGIADGLIEMALTDFDAPWGGILYDWPDLPAEKVRAQEQFVAVLSQKARAAGLPFGVAFRGVVPGDEDWSPSLDVLRDITDWLDYYMYTYWDLPYSPSPYWWAEASIQNAIRHGIEPGNIYLGLFVACWYYGEGFHHWITHDQSMQIVRQNGARVKWIEDHPAGLIREKYAAIGDNHLWIHDGETVKARLRLVDRHGLGGVMLFVLGCEAESIWKALAKWKQPNRPTRGGLSSKTSGGYLAPRSRVEWPMQQQHS